MVQRLRNVLNEKDYIIDIEGAIYSYKYNKLKPMTLQKDKDGYVVVNLCNSQKRRNVKLHREVYKAFVGEIPEGMEIDHINGKKNDNRLVNLRMCSGTENKKFQNKKNSTNTGYYGIYYMKKRDRYHVMVEGKYLGCFKYIEDAKEKRNTYLLDIGETIESIKRYKSNCNPR